MTTGLNKSIGKQKYGHINNEMGCWASDCYKLYISTPLSSIANAQSAIAAQKK